MTAEPPEFAEAWPRAHGWPAFSTGHEGETWMRAWCGTCLFGNDGDGCALVDIALVGRTPAQWETRVPGGLVTRYECTAYQPEAADRDVRAYAASMPSWPRPGGTAPNPGDAP